MPYGGRTGPMRIGLMTGRAAGFCAGFGMPGYANPVSGRGFGMGIGGGRGSWGYSRGGGGRGWQHWFYATGLPGWMRLGEYSTPYGYPMPYQEHDPELEKKALESQIEVLQKELELINKRLSELKVNSSEE